MSFNEEFNELIAKYGEDFNWYSLDMSNKTFAEQAYKEISENHPLFKVNLYSIAKCESNDDVIYITDDGRYVIIHLTYSKSNIEGFPKYAVYNSVKEIIEYLEKQYLEDCL